MILGPSTTTKSSITHARTQAYSTNARVEEDQEKEQHVRTVLFHMAGSVLHATPLALLVGIQEQTAAILALTRLLAKTTLERKSMRWESVLRRRVMTLSTGRD